MILDLPQPAAGKGNSVLLGQCGLRPEGYKLQEIRLRMIAAIASSAQGRLQVFVEDGGLADGEDACLGAGRMGKMGAVSGREHMRVAEGLEGRSDINESIRMLKACVCDP